MVEYGNNFVCVSCGSSVKSLYKQYSQSVLKLCSCEHCGSIADKYLEYDKIIILIDLILFSKEAYRHVLFNAQYKSHSKLALLQLMVISFDECIYNQNSVNLQESDSFYEATLYLLTIATVLGKIVFFVIILLFLNLCNKYSVKKPLVKSSIVKIWEAIICSSFGYFLLLTVLIWDDFQREIQLIFINTYVTLSQIQALTVTTAVPRPLLGAICTFAAAVDRKLALRQLDLILPLLTGGLAAICLNHKGIIGTSSELWQIFLFICICIGAQETIEVKSNSSPVPQELSKLLYHSDTTSKK